MDIHKCKPEDCIATESIAYYKKNLNFIREELVDLNVNLFILDHVIKFPHDLFTPPHEQKFFRMVFLNFFSASLLIITRLLTDKGADLLTLLRFKNKIRLAIKDKYQKSFDDILKETRFDKKTQEILKRAKQLRLERIAHILEGIALNQMEETTIYFGELFTIRDQLYNLFVALSFNVDHLMTTIEYSPRVEHPVEADNRSDIEKILDLIARDSPLLNMPEKNPGKWELWKKDMSASHLEILNQYRQKFSMPNL